MENLCSSGTMIAINTVIHVDRSIGITKPLLRHRMIPFLKRFNYHSITQKRFKMQSWMRIRIPLLIAFLAFILAAPVYFLYEQVSGFQCITS